MTRPEVELELEKLRHENDIRHAEMVHAAELVVKDITARLESYERALARQEDSHDKLTESVSKLESTASDLHKNQQQALTPTQIRNWILGAAGLIGAIFVIMNALNTYNTSAFIKHEEKRWLQEQRTNSTAQGP
jgi:hypothetical protein